jgi:ParB/RepB/Spo0J family partition protein
MKEFDSSTGGALAETHEEFARLPLGALIASLTQPRKTFNPEKLQELADSIKASGVHQPILVRKLPASRVEETSKANHRGQKYQNYVAPTHEIVTGERRYRASELAGAATIPALIRELSDDQVLEIQIVENLQRDDLTALEEAEGYEALMAHNKINADEVGNKIGKSRSYVYARLKLLDLASESKAALREGKLDTSRALLIARIPDGKLQLKALKFATDDSSGEAPSQRALQVWLRQNVMLQLDRAPFQITDARLVEAAGSCKTCPKRTGAAPDIFSDVDSADICTDPGCYGLKATTHTQRNTARAEAKGMRYVSGHEAKSICYEKSSTLNGYSPLSQVRNDAGAQRLDALLGKDFEGAVLIENPFTRELIEAVPTDEAEGVLLARGLITVLTPPPQESKEDLLADLKHLQYRIEHRKPRAVHQALEAAAVAAVRATDDSMATALLGSTFLRAWLLSKMDNTTEEDMAFALGYTFQEGEDEQDALVQHIRSSDQANLCRAAAIVMATEDGYYAEVESLMLNCLCDVLAVPVKKVTKLAEKAVLDEHAEELARVQAQIDAQKAPSPIDPLAQPNTARGADAKNKSPAAAGAKSAKKTARLSPEDAQLGIAEAMQGIEGKAAPAALQPVLAAVTGFAVGQQVKVTSDTDKLGMTVQKYAGKQGAITRREDGGGFWHVTFKGRTGGVAIFAEDQIEVVA